MNKTNTSITNTPCSLKVLFQLYKNDKANDFGHSVNKKFMPFASNKNQILNLEPINCHNSISNSLKFKYTDLYNSYKSDISNIFNMDFHTKAIILSDLSVIHKYISANTSLGNKCSAVFYKNDTVLRNFYYMRHINYVINHTLYLQVIGSDILKCNNLCTDNKIKDGQSHTKLSYPNFYPVRCIDILKCNNLCTHTQIFIESYILNPKSSLQFVTCHISNRNTNINVSYQISFLYLETNLKLQINFFEKSDKTMNDSIFATSHWQTKRNDSCINNNIKDGQSFPKLSNPNIYNKGILELMRKFNNENYMSYTFELIFPGYAIKSNSDNSNILLLNFYELWNIFSCNFKFQFHKYIFTIYLRETKYRRTNRNMHINIHIILSSN